MSTPIEILLITPSPELRDEVKGYLSAKGFKVLPLNTAMEAHGALSRQKIDLIMAEGDRDELQDFFRQAEKKHPGVKFILIFERDKLKDAFDALENGIDGCVFKPIRETELAYEVARILSSYSRSEEDEVGGKYIHIRSRNRRMAELYQAAVGKIASSNSTVLITGESGTGKELMAYWIYANSLRREKPLVKVSCAVLPEGVLESELFGHEKGSFTGAYTKRRGRFELADGGTIFLDEIGEIPPTIQGKFLRVLQDRKSTRLNSSHYS